MKRMTLNGAAGSSLISHRVGRAVQVASIFYFADWAAAPSTLAVGGEMNSLWSALAGSVLMCALAGPTCSRGSSADAGTAETAGRPVAAPNRTKGPVAAKAPTPGAEKSRINAAAAASSPPVSTGRGGDAARPASMRKGQGASPLARQIQAASGSHVETTKLCSRHCSKGTLPDSAPFTLAGTAQKSCQTRRSGRPISRRVRGPSTFVSGACRARTRGRPGNSPKTPLPRRRL